MIKNLLIIFAVLFVLVSSNLHLNQKYKQFLNGNQQYSIQIVSKIYSQFRSHNQKSVYRFNLFIDKINHIRAHNIKKLSWTKGLNDFSDMTFQQFKRIKLMAPQQCSATNKQKIFNSLTKVQIPLKYQWQDYGVVTPVKDQGDCGSCWTFSTVGAMESHWNILKKGKNILFSQQQLVDCAGQFENYGCDGGLPSYAFQYIRDAGGLQTSVTYPYYAKDMTCSFSRQRAVGYVKFGSYNITQNNENELAEKLYNVGPISVSFEVVDDFIDYYDGVYKTNNCGTTTMDVNHAVLATGYGVENGLPFWNIKNSWGTQWGNKGYFKIERGTNMCAIAQCNSYPLIDRAQ